MKSKSIIIIVLVVLLTNEFATAQGGLKQFFGWVSTPFRTAWGEYSEPGQTAYPPLTSFYDKSKRDQILTDIQGYIEFNKGNYRKIFKNKILLFANKTKLGNQEDWSIVNENAEIAKCAAFVALLGIDTAGNQLSYAKREEYKNKAIEILEDCDPKNLWTAFYWENQQYRAKELIMLLQAFDYLRTLHEYYGYPMSLNQIDRIEDQLSEFTRSLHGRANNWFGNYGKMNNLTILTASATGMAAIILHGKTVMFFKDQKKPKRWANAAHFYLTRALWNHEKQQSKRGEIGPFGDGPSYFEYSMESAIPFFISWNLFLGGNDHTGSYDESAMFSGTESVRNYMYDENYDNLYQWYNEIRMPNTYPPSYDDCWQSENFSALGIARTKKSIENGFTYDAFKLDDYEKLKLRGATGLNLAPDYLLALIPPDKCLETNEKVNLYSGDIIVRTNKNDVLSNQHYLHINAEKNEALNGYKSLGTGHEHGDGLNLIVAAGEDILIFDPGYLGYEKRSEINKGEHHNIITSNNSLYGNLEPDPSESEAKLLKFETSENYDLIELEISYSKLGFNRVTINRTIEVVRQNYLPVGKLIPQYHITDRIINHTIYGVDHTFHLNGNGNSNDNPSTFVKHSNKKFEWNHPCEKDKNNADNWKLYAYIDIPSSSELNIENGNAHGTLNTRLNYVESDDLDPSTTQICNGNEPKHSQVELTKHAGGLGTTIIKTTLIPMSCQSAPIDPQYTKLNLKFTSQLFSFPQINDTILNYHFSNEIDSVITEDNPFAFSDTTAQLTTNAKSIFFSYSTNPIFNSGGCVSELNFRKLKMQKGNTLIYHDTTYFLANRNIDFFYEIIGKCKYRAFSDCDSATIIDVFIPDGIVGHNMIIKNTNISSSYNDTTRILTISLPAGFVNFEIELEDPCRVSCFFPSTAETIDEQFDFNEGITQTLGHKLSIVQPHGFLNISKGSHMMLCEGIYLHNRDSLVLFSGCGKDTGQVNITTCNGEVTGKPYGQISGFGGGAKSSKITVKIGAALILEDSSFTQISNNSELHVYGTLVIKKGAKLLIGDNRTCSYATIMVYPGAYVHIENDAHLEFLKIIGDTHDRHIVFIANKPYGAGAQKGIASSILPLLQNDTIISSANVPVEICDLFTVTPTHGIANRDWGFCNLLAPKALIKIPNDTICEGECLLIDFKSSLNDPIREIEVCRIDSFMGTPILSCFGTWRLEGSSLSAGYNESSKCYYSEAQLSYFPLCDYIDSTNSWFRLFVTVKNHCDQQDTQTVYFYVANKPNSLMAMADSACPGYGTVTAYNLSENNAEKAIWHVHLLDSTQHQENDENPFYYGGDWEQFNIHYGDSFTFPDFNWVGGFKYVVNLTHVGRCGETVSKWDTIEIQPGAKIMASPSTVYSNPLGPSALQLQAFIGNANSFTWSPTSYLDNSNILNPIATPTDTITYFLATSNGNCAAFDTLHIKHNTLAFAGNIDSVCNAPVLLGTSFDASLFLAYQYYENPSAAWTQISARLTNDSSFFDKLSLYFLSEQGENALQSIGSYSDFLVSLNRAQFYEKSWYINYFMLYHQSHNYQDAFDFFVQELAKDASLTNYIGSNPMFHTGAMQTFLDLYEGEMINNNTVQLNAVWEKYTENGTQWESMGNWDDQIKIWDSVVSPTQYKITVIDNANSLVEFDQVSIWADRPVAPMFYVQFQTDSTLYFTNVSEPVQSSNVYAWNFGDGSSSNQTNPIHTFPFFDSAYVVCLTASNLCGTYTYCDTLRVDSTGLIGYSKYIVPPMNNTPKLNNPSIERGNSYEAGIKVLAYPNPFNEELNVNYQIEISYQKGELRIQNTLGETLNKISFNGNSGQIQLSTQMLSSGLYTFQIILDGRLVQTGKLARE